MKNPSQLEMAETLLSVIMEDFDEISQMSPIDMLDMLGVSGLSLTISNDASIQYLSELQKFANLK